MPAGPEQQVIAAVAQRPPPATPFPRLLVPRHAFHALTAPDITFQAAALWPQTLPRAAQVAQAAAAVEAAWRAGVQRQSVELLLPLIGATDLDDWPGGIRQQFKAAAPLVEALLKTLKVRVR